MDLSFVRTWWPILGLYAIAFAVVGTLGGILVAERQAVPATLATIARPLTALEVVSARCGGTVAADGQTALVEVRGGDVAALRCWLEELQGPAHLADMVIEHSGGGAQWRFGYRATWASTPDGLAVLIEALPGAELVEPEPAGTPV